DGCDGDFPTRRANRVPPQHRWGKPDRPARGRYSHTEPEEEEIGHAGSGQAEAVLEMCPRRSQPGRPFLILAGRAGTARRIGPVPEAYVRGPVLPPAGFNDPPLPR